MCTFVVGAESWGTSSEVSSVVSTAASGDSLAVSGSSPSSSSIETVRTRDSCAGKSQSHLQHTHPGAP